MTSMEKKLTENRLTEVKAALSAKYRTVDLGGEEFFVATDGAFFRVDVFPGAMALVIEYADTEQEARQNALEDGDRFYLDETTLDEMLRLMIAEIERCCPIRICQAPALGVFRHLGDDSQHLPVGKRRAANLCLTFLLVLCYNIPSGGCAGLDWLPHLFYWINIIQILHTVCGFRHVQRGLPDGVIFILNVRRPILPVVLAVLH